MQDQETSFLQTIRLFERTVFLIAAISLVLGFLYLAGNYQDFGVATLRQLLFVLQAISAIGAIGAVLSVLGEIGGSIHSRSGGFVIRVLFLLILGIGLAAIAAGTTGLLVFLEGTA